MNVRTNGRKVTLRDSFLEAVDKRMQKFDKYFDADTDATVTATVENGRKTAEVTVKDRGFIYRAERTADDLEQAFAEAADVIDRQIVKNKKRLGNRIKAAAGAVEAYVEHEFADEEYRVVKEKRFSVKPMTVDEAILRMNMLGHSFFLFRNEKGETCVVYKRHDDDYGLLIPMD